MNKELIKKYKTEFDHWLNGGTLLARKWAIDGNDGDTSYTMWYHIDSEFWEAEKIFNTSIEYDKTQFVINDKYVEFRKALCEGKTVQRLYTEGDMREWIPSNSTDMLNYHIKNLRIKPDEPKFKVGDWVKLTVLGKTVHRIESLIYNYNLCCYHPSLSNFNGNIDCTESLELWEPQPGEHIWDNTYGLAVVEKVSLEEGVLCRECFNSKALFTPTMKEVEPFIGTLPSFLTN